MKARMRATSILATLALLAGCGDAFRAHPDVAARLGDRELSAERLADILVVAQPLPLERDVAMQIARHWIDVSAFAKRMAAGDSLLDSARIADAMWFRTRQELLSAYRQTLAAAEIEVTEATVDSAYRVGDMIVVAHILRVVGPESTREEREEQRATAEAIRSRLLQGGSWEEENALNQDENVRAVNGYVGLVKRGQTMPRFENAAFALRPGELSRVVETRSGFHIIYRPWLDEVGEAFARHVMEELAIRFDSSLAEDLVAAESVQVREGAVAVAHDVVADPWAREHRDAVLVSYRGGEFTGARFADYAKYLSTETRVEIGRAEAEQVENFVTTLTLQEILSSKVDSAGTQLPDTLTQAVAAEYRAAVEGLWANTGLHPDSLAQVAATPGERERVAAERVDAYLEDAAARKVPLQLVPPFLTVPLLDAEPWEVLPEGVERALELAARLIVSAADSAEASPEP